MRSGLKGRMGMLLIAAAYLAAYPLYEATAQSIEDKLSRCMAIREEAARLRCFESLVPDSGTVASTPPKPSESDFAAPRSQEPAGSNPPEAIALPESGNPSDEDRFGFSAERLREREERAREQEREARKARGEHVDSKAEDDAANRRSEAVANISRNPDGRLVIATEGGQIWRQTDRERIPDPRPGDELDIRKGFMGGFMLRVNDRTIRVERVK